MLKNIKQEFIARLEQKRQEILPQSPPEYLNIIADAVHTSMNLISSSDALYHDVEQSNTPIFLELIQKDHQMLGRWRNMYEPFKL